MFPIFIRETRNNIFAILLFLMTPALFLFTGRLTAQEKIVTYYADPSSVPSDLPISIKHLTAHVSFLPEKNQVTGTAEFTFLPNRYQIDSIVFYLPDSHVSSVMINDEPVK